ncbi:MAG: zinc ribbon domain-containing protein [Atopobiaceae bacterium]|nr:zinc ribbon domain-containing protein [Coriobacteriales bacterium]MBR3158025.1 zinc ribbon domain-containing protein [Atopobiaceae bacterium]
MGMVYCAECGTKISEYADACPHCGFKGNKSTALTVREKLAIRSRAWADASLTEEFDSVLPISFVQKTRFESLFANAETLVTVAPALYNAVKEMIPDTVVAAKIPGEVQKLLDQGVVKFVTDKNGEILPTIFRDGKMFKQVRLEELKTTPELGRAVVDLQQQAALAEILHEVREVHEAVKEVTTSLHNDRLARVNAALQQLQQASLITDSRLREAKLLNITSRATVAKEMLMNSFAEGMVFSILATARRISF